MDSPRKKTRPLSVGDVVPKVDSNGKKKPTHPWRCHVDRPKTRNDRTWIPARSTMGLKV